MSTKKMIDIPTLDGVQLGPYTSLKRGVDGLCGCFYFWQDEIGKQLSLTEQRKFMTKSHSALNALAHSDGLEIRNITGVSVRNALRLRRIAYDALMSGLRALGWTT